MHTPVKLSYTLLPSCLRNLNYVGVLLSFLAFCFVCLCCWLLLLLLFFVVLFLSLLVFLFLTAPTVSIENNVFANLTSYCVLLKSVTLIPSIHSKYPLILQIQFWFLYNKGLYFYYKLIYSTGISVLIR